MNSVVRVLEVLLLGGLMLVVLPITLLVLMGVAGPFVAQFTGTTAYGRDVVGMIPTGEALLLMAIGGVLVIPVGVALTLMIAGGRGATPERVRRRRRQ
jgi:hypothetical protein